MTGAYAEASKAVHVLASHVADEGAARRWRRMGSRDAAEARGFLMAHIRRTWGIAGFIASARLVARRLETVGLTELPPRAPPRVAPALGAADPDDDYYAYAFIADALRPVVPPLAPIGA